MDALFWFTLSMHPFNTFSHTNTSSWPTPSPTHHSIITGRIVWQCLPPVLTRPLLLIHPLILTISTISIYPPPLSPYHHRKNYPTVSTPSTWMLWWPFTPTSSSSTPSPLSLGWYMWWGWRWPFRWPPSTLFGIYLANLALALQVTPLYSLWYIPS